MTARPVLAVDFSNQVYRAAAAHKLLTHDGMFTGGLYGFLSSLASAIRVTNARSVVLCCDSKPYARSALFPDYKQLRKAAQDPELKAAYEDSATLVLELAKVVGLPVWRVPGLEADDLAALLVLRGRGSVVSMSNDADLWQLFAFPNYRIYKSSKEPLLDATNTLKPLGLSPGEYVDALSLAGTHNDVPGLPRVGLATAAKRRRDPVQWRDMLDKHGDMIARNRRLIALPWEGPEVRDVHPLRQVRGRFDLRALYRWSAQFDINITSPMAEALEQVTT